MATTVSLKPNAVEISGSTSGTTTLQATAVAGTTTLTLPAATDTLVGKATTDTLTNKTLTGAVMNGTLGATTPSTVAATTLTTSSTVTHNGGTANGVPYLDGSKVLTTGSALVFDGSNLGVGVTPSAWSSTFKGFQLGSTGSIWAIASGNGGTYYGNNYIYGASGRTYLTTGTAVELAMASGKFEFSIAASGTAGNPVSFTSAMTLDASNQFYLGTAGENTPSSTRTGTAWGFGSGSNNYWINAVNSTGTANQWSFINGNGAVGSITTSGSNTTYSTSSDYRLKESIAPITGALNVVSQLNPVTYKWKVDGSDGQGFIAHELAEVIPDCVIGEKDAVETQQYEISPAVPATFDKDGNVLTPAVKAVMGTRTVPAYQGVDTSFLVATLTAAIKEQQALITQLQADVAALKGA